MEKQEILDKIGMIFGLNNIMLNKFYRIKFLDEKLEEDFTTNNLKSTRTLRILVNFFILLLVFLRIFLSMRSYVYPQYLYFDLTMGVCTLIVCLLMHFVVQKTLPFKILNFTYSILILITNIYTNIFSHVFYINKHISEVQIRDLYIMIIISLIDILYFYEYNFFHIFTIALCNFLMIALDNYFNDVILLHKFKDIFVTVSSILLVIIIRRRNHRIVRENYLHNIRREKYFSYSFDLINNMNAIYFTLDKNNNIFIYNKNLIDYFNNLPSLNTDDKNLIISNKYKQNEINLYTNNHNSTEGVHSHKEEETLLNLTKENVRQGNRQHSHSDYHEAIDLNMVTNFNIKDHLGFKNKTEMISSDFNKNNIDNNLLREQKLKVSSKIYLKEEQKKRIFSDDKIEDKGKTLLEILKKNNLAEDYSHIVGESLMEILQSLKESCSDVCDQTKFKYLGDFFIEQYKNFFQVFFRKESLSKGTIDFLLYDRSKIKEAEEREKFLKSKFFAKIAHRLKTPIIAVISQVNKLFSLVENRPFDNQTCLNILNEIENLSNYAVFLMDDIIEYSNIYIMGYFKNIIFKNENSHSSEIEECPISKKFYIEEINTREVNTFCYNILTSLLRNKQKDIYIQAKNSFDERILQYKIFSNNFKIRQILINLITNAVQFTKSGFIQIKFSLKQKNIDEDNEKNKLKISIIDSGVGLKNSEISDLFTYKENLYKVNNEQEYENDNLGLIIAKFWADKLGHKLTIKSEYGVGTTISLSIYSLQKNLLKSRDDIFFNNFDIKNENKILLNNHFNTSRLNSNKLNISYLDKFCKYNKKIDDDNNYFLSKINYLQENLKARSEINKSKKDQAEEFKYIKFNSMNESFYKGKDAIVKEDSNHEYNQKLNCTSNVDTLSNRDELPNPYKYSLAGFLKQNFVNSSFDEGIQKYKKKSGLIYLNKTKSNRRFSSFEISDAKKNEIFKNYNINNTISNNGDNNYEIYGNKRNESICDKRNIILILDDHIEIRKGLKNLIEKILIEKNLENDFKVKEGRDGVDLVYDLVHDQLENNKIKCIMTDENMEFMNGSEAIKIVRNMEVNRKIKHIIIASITAYEDEIMKKFISDAGVNKILSKPCNKSNLINFFKEFKIFELE